MWLSNVLLLIFLILSHMIDNIFFSVYYENFSHSFPGSFAWRYVSYMWESGIAYVLIRVASTMIKHIPLTFEYM